LRSPPCQTNPATHLLTLALAWRCQTRTMTRRFQNRFVGSVGMARSICRNELPSAALAREANWQLDRSCPRCYVLPELGVLRGRASWLALSGSGISTRV
jgi:hypothetical protein